MSGVWFRAVGVALGLLLWPSWGEGRNIPCGPAEDGVIFVDGLLGDWKGVAPVSFGTADRIVSGRKHWNDAADLSFDLRCNYSGQHVYLAVDVRDEYFACAKKKTRRDHLELRFGRQVLRVFPGDLKKIPGAVFWGTKRAKGLGMAEARRPHGWAVELKLPKSQIPGYREGGAAIGFNLQVVDVDWRAVVDTVMETGALRVVVAQVAANVGAFLAAMKASPKDVRLRLEADVVGDRGVEQVLRIGRTIGVIGAGVPGGGGYFYFQLPVKHPQDIEWVKLLDLNGDRQKEIVVRLTQRGNGGWRSLIEVYRFNSVNKFGRWFGHELAKGQGPRRIDNRLRFKRRRGGLDIVVDQPVARGFDAQNYREEPAVDVHSIVLPWDEKKVRVFRFEGDDYGER